MQAFAETVTYVCKQASTIITLLHTKYCINLYVPDESIAILSIKWGFIKDNQKEFVQNI